MEQTISGSIWFPSWYWFCYNFLRFFSKEPHIAGSTRQKELAVELAKRWKEYGFDRVEQPEYKALLSFPNTTHPTRITIKYKNGTIIHQIKGEEQVRLETAIWLLFTDSVCTSLTSHRERTGSQKGEGRDCWQAKDMRRWYSSYISLGGIFIPS